MFAVTRQRLLQQGSTNTTTYNFETSENLYILLADRDLEAYTLTDIQSCGPLAAHIPISTGFNSMEDSYTKIAEIPHKMMWSKKFPWPRLHHGYMWRLPIDIQNPDSFNVLMPGAQGEINVNDNNRLTQQEEILTSQLYSLGEVVYTSNTIQPRVSYPRMHMAQPKIPDETGIMKFRYAIRMSAETHLLFHLIPDHVRNSSRSFSLRPPP